MIWNEHRSIRIAILDMNDGQPNQGMRCIRQIVKDWAATVEMEITCTEFDVRKKNQLPDTSFDIYISSGGPGDPLSTRFDDWDIAWCKWVDEMLRWNSNPSTTQKKYVFLFAIPFNWPAVISIQAWYIKESLLHFGVFPVHMLEEGKTEPVFDGLNDPFYAVDSRDYQVIQPNHALIKEMGGSLLCIEKDRPHVPYERAVMGIRFNEYMIGTQFHPEADAEGMTRHFETEEKRNTVIENHGEQKLNDMLMHLNDPDKIRWTYSHILPNFLNQSIGQLEPSVLV